MKSKKGEADRGLQPSEAPKAALEFFAGFEPARPSLEKYGQKFIFDCEICGARMIEHHCKIKCPSCGYVRDCSDP